MQKMNTRIFPIDMTATIYNVEAPRKIDVINEWLWHSVTIVLSLTTCCCCCGCCGNYSPKVLYG